MSLSTPNSKIGFLIVITGLAGSGKDTVMTEFLKHHIVKSLNIQRVITCTDRKIRTGEAIDAYYFLTSNKLDRLAKLGHFVEEVVNTGTSRKATLKSEITKLFSGVNLLWRIDPSRAVEIVKGEFFHKHFPESADILIANTLVICLKAPKGIIEERRKRRISENNDSEDFMLRDVQESPHLDILMKKAVVVENRHAKIIETVESIATHVAQHHAKIKNKKAQ